MSTATTCSSPKACSCGCKAKKFYTGPAENVDGSFEPQTQVEQEEVPRTPEKLTAKQRYMKEYRKTKVEQRLAAGLCVDCGVNLPAENRTTCDDCEAKKRKASQKHTAEGLCRCGNPRAPGLKRCEECIQRVRDAREERKRLGVCACGNPVRPGFKSCEKCINRSRQRNYTVKKAVIDGYGGRCECCGERTFELLSVDHIHGNGAEDREKGLSGHTLYQWLIENNFPDGYQLLCMGCNFAKRDNVECPHKKHEREMLAVLSNIPLTY